MDTKITTVHIRAMQERDIPAVREIDRMSFSLPWPERAYRYEITKTTTSLLYVAKLDEPGEDGRVVGSTARTSDPRGSMDPASGASR